MSNKNLIEISYIKEKVDKSPIITVEDNISIVDSQSEITDIKNSIMGILECTDIKEKIEKNTQGRHLYKLQDEVSGHINSVISGKYNNEEKKEIIKDILKTLSETINFVLIRGGNFYINDGGKNQKIINIKNQKKIEKRFNGYEGEELEELIKDYIGDNKDIQNFIKNTINNINYSKLHLDQIISILTLGYKTFLLTEISKSVQNRFNLEDEITKAISGKILRDNFSYSNIILYENIYNTLLKNKLEQINIEKEIIDNIINKYFNFQKDNIYDNISHLNKIFKNELDIIISEQLNKLFLFEGKISEPALKVIVMKIKISLNKEIYKEIITNIIDNLIKTFRLNTSKLPKATIDFLKTIGIKYPEIKVSYLNSPTDIIKLSSTIKLLLTDNERISNSIKRQKNKIVDLKKENENTSKSIKGLETKFERNKKEINNQLIKIGFKSLIDTELVSSSLIEESKNLYDKQISLNKILKNLTSNTIKKTLNSSKIEKINKEITKIKKRINSVEIIIKLLKENITIKSKIKKYYEINKSINNTLLNIKNLDEELLQINDKIAQIKEGLIKIFLASN